MPKKVSKGKSEVPDGVALQSGGPNPDDWAPYAPILRAGHYDHVPPPLVPQKDEHDHDDIVSLARHPLEKSSSSFLDDLSTPPSTPEEEEPGQAGFHLWCGGAKKHYVDRKLGHNRIGGKFCAHVLLLGVLSNVPILILEIMYVWWDGVRHAIVVDYYSNWHALLCLLMLVLIYLILNYFSGLARNSPFHIIMLVTKVLVWSFIFVLVGAWLDYIYIYSIIVKDPVYHYYIGQEDYKEATIMWKEFVTETYTGTRHDLLHIGGYAFAEGEDKNAVGRSHGREHHEHDEDDKDAESEDDLVRYKRRPNCMFLFGISYAIFNLLLLRLLVAVAKMNYFGPIFPFMSYSLTGGLILLGSLLLVSEAIWPRSPETLWFVAHCVIGPALGTFISEHFIIFLRNLLTGRLCPLKRDEHIYAILHY